MINCTKEGVYILTKEEANEVEELVWCQSCFEELWREAAEDGWRGDDIEERLRAEEEEEDEEDEEEEKEEREGGGDKKLK